MSSSNERPSTARRVPTCDVCGVALDGVQWRPHRLLVLHDGAMVAGETLCFEHADKTLAGYRDVRQEVAYENDRTRGLFGNVAAGAVVPLARRGGEA